MVNRLPAHFRLGDFAISADDIVRLTLHCSPDEIQPKVVLVPSWATDTFAEASALEETSENVWQVSYGTQRFTLVRSGIGAPLAGETVLALGCTPCHTLVIAGSVGALVREIDIGDMFLVERAICGDGFTRYLGESVAPGDCMGQPVEPDAVVTGLLGEKAEALCRSHSTMLHRGIVYSLDCILPEFFRLTHFADELGCSGMDMEAAAVFSAAQLVGIRAAALLQVSDNSLQGKSLYSGRTDADRDRRRLARRSVLVPAILDCLASS